MQIKKTFFLTLLTLSYLTINAQYSGVQSNDNFTENIISNFQNAMRLNGAEKNGKLSTVKGSPYENETFVMGKAKNKITNKSEPYYLRYNIYNDVIEIQDSGDLIGLVKSLNIYALIYNNEYHYEIYSDDNIKTNEGYFILLSKGTNSSLYLRKTSKFKNKVKAKDAYHKEIPAAFINSESFYLKTDRILFPVPEKKKKFLQKFPKLVNKLKKYMKSENINLKSQKDVIKLHIYLDSLLK